MLFTATNFRMLSLALAGVLAIASFTSAELIRTVQRGNLPIEPTHFTVSHDAPRSWRRDGDSFANATLSRRAGGKVRNVHLSDGFHSDLAIDGKYFTLGFDLSDDGITFQAHDDNPLAWDPKTSKAKPGGLLGGRFKGKEYQVDIEWDGNPFKGVSVVAGISDGSRAFTGEVGCIGLGLSNSHNNFVGRSFPSLAKVIPFFGLDYTTSSDTAVLSIGAAPHKIKQHFMVPSAMKDRWTVKGDLNGHPVPAMDFTPNDVWVYGPKKDVIAIMEKGGLTPKTLPGSHASPIIYAEIDCKKRGPPLVLTLQTGASLTYEGFSTSVIMKEGGCQFILRGSDDPSYPTDWSFGNFAMTFPMIFDARSGNPQVGFGAPRDG